MLKGIGRRECLEDLGVNVIQRESTWLPRGNSGVGGSTVGVGINGVECRDAKVVDPTVFEIICWPTRL